MEVEAQNGHDDDEAMDGAILSVHVQNFFCHENFRVEFKKRVTFIVGRNGSGKSAILTALVVGLGGKALDTNRGKNVQSFVKKGANSANIEIRIKNSGQRAYKPEEYGDVITIVKTLSASGASNYKIRSSAGRLVHSNAKEVNAIVTALNIQVNNPISVLNQDDARDFSLKMDPKKLYNLFMRATNLDIIEENYERARAGCLNAFASWEKKNNFCIDLKNEYTKWKNLHKQMRSQKEIQKQLKLLKAELCWSEIAATEQEIAVVREQSQRQRAKCTRMDDALRAMEQSLAGAATEALEKQLAEHKQQKEELERQLRPLERAAHEARAAHTDAGAALARHSDLLARAKRRVKDYEREIESGSAGSQRESEELQRRAELSRAAAEEARARVATLRNDAQQARSHSARLADDVERAHAERSRLAARLKQRQQELRELQSRGADSLAVYGGVMSELCGRVAAAAQRGHFSAPPRGPVGQYIRVRDKQWAGALEHIIGGLIRGFCVNTAEDSRKLFRIIDQVWQGGGKPTVTCSRFLDARHDVRGKSVRAPAPYCSALQALLVEDAVVANFLIDNLSLERVLLVPEHEAAERLADTAARVPPNCAKIVTLDCSEYHPAPDYRAYGGRARAARFLSLDSGERMRQLRTEIQELETELQQHDENLKQLIAEQRRASERERAVSKALQAMGAELLQREAEADTAAAARDMRQAPQLAVLDDELNLAKQTVQELTEKLSELTENRERCMRELEDCEAKMSELKAQVAQAAADCRRLGEEISQEEMKMDRGAAERRGLQQRLKEERDKLTRVEEILRGKEEALASRIQAAKVPRVDNPREPAVLTKLVAESKKKMSSLELNISREEVERELEKAERNYGRTQRLLDELRAFIDRIEKMAAEYLENCCKLKTDIGRHIGIHFMATLTTRGYHGQIHIDHQNDELKLEVSGREGSRSASSTASLSGGERSYTTVAFITSLWECVELPFYFMDEFDVFMDDVNQQIAVTLLLDMAARLAGRQFVFLTPHGAKLSLKDAPVPADVISLGNPRQE